MKRQSKELISYLKDIRFLIPFGFLVGFELFMQSGLYKYLLRPRSYAENVNHIVRVVNRSHLQPNLLILGTSVPYQGIQMKMLNESLRDTGIVAQSGACEGAMLITQQMIFRSISPAMPRLKVVLHVMETTFPWTARHTLDRANRSMVAQFSRQKTISLLERYEYDLTRDDLAYFWIRSLTYQKDIKDFALSPLNRIKWLGRRYREPLSEYVYENEYTYSLSAYPSSNLQECVAKATAGVPEKNAQGVQITDMHHRQAVIQTCRLGMYDPSSHPGASQWRDLFFRRLKIFYDEMYAKGYVVITLFPPYSSLIKDFTADRRMEVWYENLRKIHGDRPYYTIDLRHSLDRPDNLDLYYDTIHLNRPGSLLFTKAVARELKKLAPQILADRKNEP